ncbi:MAG: hypothetical protein MI924_17825 [Chloroflexales bacterium]|nr:hypothetical protein [Chloroflexales bacterium]
MNTQVVSLPTNVRIWQDERIGRFWRIAYPDGDSETVVGFPDSAALGDFLVEHFGLSLVDALKVQNKSAPKHTTQCLV